MSAVARHTTTHDAGAVVGQTERKTCKMQCFMYERLHKYNERTIHGGSEYINEPHFNDIYTAASVRYP